MNFQRVGAQRTHSAIYSGWSNESSLKKRASTHVCLQSPNNTLTLQSDLFWASIIISKTTLTETHQNVLLPVLNISSHSVSLEGLAFATLCHTGLTQSLREGHMVAWVLGHSSTEAYGDDFSLKEHRRFVKWIFTQSFLDRWADKIKNGV